MSGRDRERRVCQAFVTLADATGDPAGVLARLVGYAVELLAADAGVVLLVDRAGRSRVLDASSDDARLLAEQELRAGEGPGLDCARDRAPVRVPDLAAAAHRWPRFVAAAPRGPAFRAVHALPLSARDETLGALILFGYQPGALPHADLVLGQALAEVTTIGLLREREVRHARTRAQQLETALTSRVVIEQAKGLLAWHAKLSMDDAFDRMRRYARSHNQRLDEVARALVEQLLDPDVLIAQPPG